ncbi:MAG: glycerophosphodiester phosphodiesterase [Planctomycetota bacterium]
MRIFLAVLTVVCLGHSNASGQLSDAAPAGVSRPDQTAAAPIVIAHRGASGYLPEHSLEAAAFAHALEADYIEQDCVLSKDGIPVVMHDLTLDDLTNVRDIFPGRQRSDGRFHVMDFTLAELRQLNATERRSPNRTGKNSGSRFPIEQGAFRISTLEEHLQLIQGLNRSRRHQAGVYVEIKDPGKHREAGQDASAAILKVLTQYGYDSADDRIYLQCFDQAEVRRLREELKCPLPLVWLTAKALTPDQLREARGFCDGLGLLLTLVVTGADSAGRLEISAAVNEAHAVGLPVHVWTWRSDALPKFVQNGESLLEALTVDAGVDGIFADQPDLVLAWRRQRMQQAGRGNPFRLLRTANPRQDAADR